MLIEIDSLDSQSTLLKYLDSGYWNSANMALNVLQEESKNQNNILFDLYRGARVLRMISLNRKLLGLDENTREQAKGEVTGFLYGLASIWDFLLGAVIELSKDSRTAARKILRDITISTIDLLDGAVDKWSDKADVICQQALSDYAQRLDAVSEKKEDAVGYAAKLQKRLIFLMNLNPYLQKLRSEVQLFTANLRAAHERILASCQPDFQAVLFTADGEATFRKGKEQDLLLLNNLSESPWKHLEIRSGGRICHFHSIKQRSGSIDVVFLANISKDIKHRVPVVAPKNANRFELRLSTLEGRFR